MVDSAFLAVICNTYNKTERRYKIQMAYNVQTKAKTVLVNFRTTDEVSKKIQKVSTQLKVTKSDFIRQAVENELKLAYEELF